MDTKTLPVQPLRYVILLFLAVSPASCGSEPGAARYKSLLIGAWQERTADLQPGDKPPRMRFESDGNFHSRSAVGETGRGTWRWTSHNSVEVRWDNGSRNPLRIRKLTSQSLVIGESELSKFVRVESHPKARAAVRSR